MQMIIRSRLTPKTEAAPKRLRHSNIIVILNTTISIAQATSRML